MKVGDKIFVYGTLKPGQSNGSALSREGRGKHICTTRINGRIYDLGSFPGLKIPPVPTEEELVVGDVFEIVDPRLPDYLDMYEGYPSLYDRRKVITENDLEVWVYTFNGSVSENRLIQDGVWQ